MNPDAAQIPLSLYIHVPWCVQKCPYCDFNSHQADTRLPENGYIDALLTDLRSEWPQAAQGSLHSIFLGGGTPSLLRAQSVDRLLRGVESITGQALPAEVTLEANPGTAEQARFSGYRDAGISRLSLGIQTLDNDSLQQLGRIHDRDEALNAIRMARQAGYERINLDLMFGLPGQTPEHAVADLEQLLRFDSGHLSWYQLTIEPNTLFHHQPPRLPNEDNIFEIQQAGEELLNEYGYEAYEISAWSKPGQQCRHNLNYWGFGDYIGIGAGAHGKLTGKDGGITRYSKRRNPRDYLATPALRSGIRTLDEQDRLLEFMLNALRLRQGYSEQQFQLRTGLDSGKTRPAIDAARAMGWMETSGGITRPTDIGRRYLNNLLALFDA